MQSSRDGAAVTPALNTSNRVIENVNPAQAALLSKARAERKKVTMISCAVFILFVAAAFIQTLPSGASVRSRQKSELIFTIALIALVGLGVAISVKVSLNKKIKARLEKDLKTLDSKPI